MADNPQHDAPLPDPDGAGGEVVSEDDLDALLVEASQLASEISGEAGSAETDATPASAENQLESDLSSLNCDDIDSQLANLDRLVDETQSEIGIPIAADAPSDLSPGDAVTNEVDPSDLPNAGDSTAPSTHDLPDFLSEFTQPPAEPPLVAPNQELSDLTEPEFNTQAKSAAGHTTTQVAKTKPNDLGCSSGQTTAMDHAGPKKGLPLLMTRLGVALSPMAIRVADKAVGVLEAVNSPTKRIGVGIRTAVGWLAIATIGTSVLVFLTSLF